MNSEYTYSILPSEDNLIKNSEIETIIDLSGTMFLAVNSDGIVTMANKKTCTVLGYAKEEIIGKNWFDNFIPKNIKNEIKNLAQKLINNQTKETQYYENAVLTKNGNQRTIFWHNSVIKNSDGETIGLLSSGDDITEKKLIETQNKYQAIFAESYSIMIIIDSENGNITDANQAAAEFYGYSREKLKQMNIAEINTLPPEKIKDEMKKVSEKKINKLFLKHKLSDGTIKDVEVYIGKITYDNRNFLYSIIHDITDRIKAEEKLKANEQKLIESNLEKDKFLSILAHDLRSPFNAILGFSDLLTDKSEKYSEQQRNEFQKILHSSIQNTYKLLENLLIWSQIQRGKIEFNPEKQNLLLTTTDAVEPLKHTAEAKSIIIENKISEKICFIADRNMLQTIVRNLVSNAIKFTPDGGKITLTSCTAKSSDKNYTEICVTDTGIGIKPETAVNLFTLTQNNSTQGTKNETGTGLGLIICKEFAEKHGGTISVNSQPGIGSKFIVSLPLL